MKLLGSAVLALLAATTAQAADIGAPTYNWTGAYIGVQAGGRWAEEHLFGHAANGETDFYNKPSGGLVGGYIGYNHQFENVMLGIEAGAALNSVTDIWTIQHYDYKTTAEQLFNINARLGYVLDKSLIYGTAGYAHTKYKLEYIDFEYPSETTSRSGWNIGVGAEYAVTDNIIARAEYRYYDFGKINYVGAGRSTYKQQTAVLGLAYKF